MTTLSAEQLQSQLPEGWTGDEQGVKKSFSFPSYESGVAFAVQVALMAQKTDHHPDSLTIGWKRVEVVYVTHSAGGVTDLDVRAAQAVNAAFDG